MGKISGLGMSLTVANSASADIDISNDVTGISLKTSQGEVDVTGLDKEATERLLLLGDAEISVTGSFNPALSHLVFKDIHVLAGVEVGRDVTIGYPPAAATTLSMVMIFFDYTVERGSDGALTWTATGKLSDGTVPTF